MPGSRNLLISTRNEHKVREIHAIMTDLPIKLLSLDAFPDALEVIEDRDTLEGNAAKKAQEIYAIASIPTCADDTGLEVLALDGAPGVLSARFAGENCTPADNRAKLLDEMRGKDDRRAQFRTVVAFTTATGTFLFEGSCRGRIIEEERGTQGFGYDSLFVPYGFDQTFAEMNPEQKNKISHRGRAFTRFVSYLSGLLDETP